MPSDLLEYVCQGKDRWSMASSRLLEHPLTHLLPMAAFSLWAILKSLKKKGYAPTKHKMYTVLSITRKGMLILGLTDVRDSKQLNTKVKNRKK